MSISVRTAAPQPRKYATALAAVLTLVCCSSQGVDAQQARLSFYEPGISPDGGTIAFVHGGDIWTVPSTGGDARILIAHEEEESRPIYSPDGGQLAFESYRDGTSHVYLYDFSSGAVTQLTYMSTSASLEGWSTDSEWIYFSSVSHDISGMTDVFRVRATGGTPMPVLADRYAGEFWAAPAADGRIAISTRGKQAFSQWWRHGRSHMDEAEIWVADPNGGTPSYTAVSTGGKNQWPMWMADGRIAFVSDRDGDENLWAVEEGAASATRLTDLSDGRVLWPTYSAASGGRIAFERDFRIWTHDVSSGRTAAINIRPVGAVQGPRAESTELTSFYGFTISPDSKKLVVTSRGEIFAGAAEEGEAGPLTTRVTNTPSPEGEVRWASDSRRIVYSSARNGSSDLFVYDFPAGSERQITSGAGSDAGATWEPDGDRLVYVRDGGELHLFDTDSNDDQVVARGLIGFGSRSLFGAPVWSPDGRWLAYMATPDGEFWNVHVVPADGSAAPRAVSFLPNTFGGNVLWAPDGKSIYYSTNQRYEDTRVVRIDLQPRTPTFREDALDELFEVDQAPTGAADADAEETDEAAEDDDATPVEIDFDGIRSRYELLPIPFSTNEMAISPDGKMLVLSGSAAGQPNLYSLNLDPLSTGPSGVQAITSGPGGKGGIEFATAPDRVWFIQGGRVRSVGTDGKGARTVTLRAEMEIDFHAEKDDVFLENWTILDEGFYDADHHGADWDGIRRDLAPIIAGSRNRQEMRRALLLMTGELNGSHLGVSGSESPSTPQVGRLGLRFDRAAYEGAGRLIVSEVIPLSPAAVSGEFAVGSHLVAVNGTTIDGAINLNQIMRGTVGERTALTIADASGGASRTVVIQPISLGAEKNLLYESWVESRRAYVAQVSNGRLGYVHIPDMSEGSLQGLYLDLDQENRDREGVVVDVRHNNGGSVNGYALDVFTRPSFMTMQPRGGVEASSRHQLGQRSYLDPVILVTNQNTLSDGEDFSEGWRVQGIGEIVGEPTAGWIIYTSNLSLFDGTRIRLPFIGVRGADGQDMELNPRPVDVQVERPAGESYQGRDSQLDTAVRRLLARIDGGG